MVLNTLTHAREWDVQDKRKVEAGECQYMGMKLVGGLDGGVQCMEVTIGEINSLLGMVKFAVKMSGSQFVIGRKEERA